MIIVDMPWIMNGEDELVSAVRMMPYILWDLECKYSSIPAAWKIVRTWLGPEAISKLKFASKSEVQTYIDPEYLPAHLGGTVCYSVCLCGMSNISRRAGHI